MTALRRHTLVWLSQPPEADTDDDRVRAAGWQAARRPFVVTRRRSEGHGVGLGFCTTDARHPELRPRRIAAHADPHLIARHERPPTLEEVARSPAAASRAGPFDRLRAKASEAGLDIRVYGSWMWQALTDEPHVHDASDLDVLIDVADAGAAEHAAAFLQHAETDLAFKIDGELSIAGLGEVHWREVRQGKAEVLLKTVDTLRLVSWVALRA